MEELKEIVERNRDILEFFERFDKGERVEVPKGMAYTRNVKMPVEKKLRFFIDYLGFEVLDEGKLEMIVQLSQYSENPTLKIVADILNLHPLVDGNKRLSTLLLLSSTNEKMRKEDVIKTILFTVSHKPL